MCCIASQTLGSTDFGLILVSPRSIKGSFLIYHTYDIVSLCEHQLVKQQNKITIKIFKYTCFKTSREKNSEKFWNYSRSTVLNYLPGYLLESKNICRICKNSTEGKIKKKNHVPSSVLSNSP